MRFLVLIFLSCLALEVHGSIVINVKPKAKVVVVHLSKNDDLGFRRGDRVKISGIHAKSKGTIKKIRNHKLTVKLVKPTFLVKNTHVNVLKLNKVRTKAQLEEDRLLERSKYSLGLGIRGGMVLPDSPGGGGDLAFNLAPDLQAGILAVTGDRVNPPLFSAGVPQGGSVDGLEMVISATYVIGFVRYYPMSRFDSFYLSGGAGAGFYQASFLLREENNYLLRELKVQKYLGYGSFGNLWRFGSFYAGVEWAAAIAPIQTSVSASTTSTSEVTEAVDDARYGVEGYLLKSLGSISYQAVMLQLGFFM